MPRPRRAAFRYTMAVWWAGFIARPVPLLADLVLGRVVGDEEP